MRAGGFHSLVSAVGLGSRCWGEAVRPRGSAGSRREAVTGMAKSWGDALQVFPPTRESWQQKSVFVFISLKKKKGEKDT